MSINPIKLIGNWDEGYALDKHVIQSIPIGEDAYGHMQFDTTRSEIGELVYQLKYRSKIDNIEPIINLAKPFLNKWAAIKSVDVIFPVPSSKINRPFQPAFEIAHGIADYLKKPFLDNVLVKSSSAQSKDMDINQKQKLKGTISITRKGIRGFSVLIVDDLFQTGSTLTECVNALKDDNNLKNVYVLTMSKTKG